METIEYIQDLPELCNDAVHIWGIHVPDMLDRMEALQAVLNRKEQDKAARFYRDTDRYTSIAARGALRILLGAYTGIAPEDIRFAYSENGKPFFVPGACDTAGGQGRQDACDTAEGQGGQDGSDTAGVQGRQDACDTAEGQGRQDACDTAGGQGRQDAYDTAEGQGGQDACDTVGGQGRQDACDTAGVQGRQDACDTVGGQGRQDACDTAEGQGRQDACGAVGFNVSHSGDWVVLAFGRNREVGVDVERIRRKMDVMAIASRYFTPEESLRIEESADVHHLFFHHWCRKEAYIKAVGSALFRELSTFAVPNDDVEKEGWHFYRLEAGSDYAAAMVTDKAAQDIPCFDFCKMAW